MEAQKAGCFGGTLGICSTEKGSLSYHGEETIKGMKHAKPVCFVILILIPIIANITSCHVLFQTLVCVGSLNLCNTMR